MRPLFDVPHLSVMLEKLMTPTYTAEHNYMLFCAVISFVVTPHILAAYLRRCITDTRKQATTYKPT